MTRRLLGPALAVIALLTSFPHAPVPQAPVYAQTGSRHPPLATLEPAPRISFPSPADSNSPVFWALVDGHLQMAIINSAPDPQLSVGPNLPSLAFYWPVSFDSATSGARWFEAVVPDDSGHLYGYYHNEPVGLCEDPHLTAPRIGAARSDDGGLTWIDLGVVIERPAVDVTCATANRYFAGGVGDFSVVRDQSGTFAYFFFSVYGTSTSEQGVAVARMLWAHRDEPVGQVATWSAGAWRYPEPTETGWQHATATPILPAADSWHDPSRGIDAFWGPSVHWNTYLNRFVMLLNRAVDAEWTQEGVYLSSTSAIDSPSTWLAPQRLLTGGTWYPQVVGLEHGLGTDRLAGQRARFFMGGESDYEIVFAASSGIAQPRK